jgi:hypothetical protein
MSNYGNITPAPDPDGVIQEVPAGAPVNVTEDGRPRPIQEVVTSFRVLLLPDGKWVVADPAHEGEVDIVNQRDLNHWDILGAGKQMQVEIEAMVSAEAAVGKQMQVAQQMAEQARMEQLRQQISSPDGLGGLDLRNIRR